MRRSAMLLAIMMATMIAVEAAAELGWGLGGDAGVAAGGGGGGIRIRPVIDGNGETPRILVSVDIGYDVAVNVAYSFAGRELPGFYDGGVRDTVLYTEAVTDSAETKASRVSETIYLDDAIRGFDGDTLTVWLDVFADELAAPAEYVVGLTLDAPGEIMHAVVTGAGSTPTDHIYAEYIAQGATVYTWGEDMSFAYVYLDSTDWDGGDPDGWNGISTRGGDQYLGDMQNYVWPNAGNPGQTFAWLVRCPLDTLLGENATVIDARMNVRSTGNMYLTKADSLVAILNETPGDTLWWAESNLGGLNNRAYAAMSSWRYQVQGLDDTNDATSLGHLTTWGYPATSAGRWQIGERTSWLDWGSVIQMTSEPDVNNGFDSGGSGIRFVAGDVLGYRIGRIVQAVHEGKTDNGILYFVHDPDGTGGQYASSHYNGTANYRPYYTISWVEGDAYDPVFPTGPDGTEAPLVATFATDDGRITTNDHFSDVFEAAGVSYTINLQRSYMDTLSNFWGADDAAGWLEQGMELATHGFKGYTMTHYDSVGVDSLISGLYSMPTDCRGPADTSGVREMLHDVDPCWMTNLFGASTYVGATHGANQGSVNVASMFSSKLAGHTVQVARGLGKTNITKTGSWPDGGWYVRGFVSQRSHDATGATEADTLYSWFSPHDLRDPINIQGACLSMQSLDLVGGRQDTLGNQITEATIRRQVRKKIAALAGKNVGVMSWYAHDEKDLAPSYTDSNGITADEMEIVLDELYAQNVPIYNTHDTYSWRAGLAIHALVPSGWGNYADWQPKSKAWTTWGRMRWLDAAKVQGIPRKLNP